MSEARTRRRLLSSVALAVAAGLTGCSTHRQPDTAPNGTSLTDSTAKERALAAEAEYLRSELSGARCLDSWGTSATAVRKNATVTNRTADGVRVAVVHPYWSTESWTEPASNRSHKTHTDGGSHAHYLVTPATVERVDGDSLAPC
ncbi:hypothetical protein KI372_08590 [Halobacterium salinarum]|uniref:hypothetical protein n=1 Tax=Halobacterium salinarum TaxID=2242 RepID=UPI001F3F1154|nr:hypothetical protein [Halobacterium salinarum]MCF2207356.1 hypothetical protein [Halobacterium salinarum]MCF2241410.1 hypothetical protein [Halobacterium salinarum]